MFYPFLPVFPSGVSIQPGTQFSVFLFENDFLALFPELFLVMASLILLTAGVLVSTSLNYSKPILVTQSSWLCVYSCILCYILVLNSNLNTGYIFYNCLVQDPLTLFLKKLLILATIVTIFISLEYNKQESHNQFELMVLLVISTCSMLFLIQSADLIACYLAIELQSLCFYVMAALKSNSPFSSEAGLKYFLLGAFSSGILLFGCSLVYGFTGVTEFINLSKILSCGTFHLYTPTLGALGDLVSPLNAVTENSISSGQQILKHPENISPLRGCELGMIFICVAFLFKITAVPFHLWAPDVYEGAPTTVTAYFSIAPKIALLGLMIRIFGCSDFVFMFSWQKILIFSSIMSMTFATFAALSQNKIKRLLAFSSIGQVGYMLLALSLDSLLGVQALCTYIVIYVVMTVSLFAIFLLHLGRQDAPSGTALGKLGRMKYINDLTQLGITNPTLAACLTVTMFSMAGIPPLAGFYAKAALLLAALSSCHYVLAVVAVLTSVMSSYYYIRLVKIMYFEKSKQWLCLDRPQKASALTLSSCLFFLIFFMIYPSPLYLASLTCTLNVF